MLIIDDLQCNYERAPMGVAGCPAFSWKLKSDQRDTFQKKYQIQIFLDKEMVFSTGEVQEQQSVDVAIDGWEANPASVYEWEVTVWDNHGQQAAARSRFETAPEQLKAKWIEPSNGGIRKEKQISIIASQIFHAKPKLPPQERLMPVTHLRKDFTVKGGVSRARAYATAHGIYELAFNGKRAGESLFAPEFTPYDKMLCYQTYDITGLLTEGKNSCQVRLADGWWSGRIGMTGECCQYGDTRGYLMQVEIVYEDGTKEVWGTDESFEWSDEGEIRYADLFIGEMQDHNFTCKHWEPVTVKDYGQENLCPQTGAGVTVTDELPLKEIIHTPKGETVLDFGQNIAGYVRVRVNEAPGTVIRLEHSEILDEKGNYLNNIMGVNKDQTDVFVCAGGGEEVFEPRFTFHGFRYVRITGIQNLEQAEFTAVALSSDMRKTGSFSCSNEKLNRLYDNVNWSQKANMISIPTDCPQRERAGWTGDIQVFAATAIFHRDMNAFLRRWLFGMEAEQFADGQIPCIIPYNTSYRRQMEDTFGMDSCCGWSDAAIIIPYTMYRLYGDRSLLRRFYPMMKRWMDYVEREAAQKVPKAFAKKKHKTPEEIENQKYLWNTGWHFGDWLIPSQSKSMLEATKSGKLTKEIVAPMYYAYDVQLMAEIAETLGKQEEARRYQKLHGKIRKAFAETYVSAEGRMKPDLQGVYVLALWLELIPEEKKQLALEHLLELIEENHGCLDTGFLATPVLLDVLMKYGKSDAAYRILYQEQCPSWLYEIKMGATTMWENWGAVKPDGKVSIYSYNHYALGCVCDWMYRFIAGIRNDSAGYQQIVLHPQPDDSLTWAKGSYESVYGQISCEWKREDNRFILKAEIPCNTKALVVLPNHTQREVGSGTYEFTCLFDKEQQKRGEKK